MVGNRSLFRPPNVKGLMRRNKNKLVGDDIPVQARLPQEILNQIIAEYRTSYPEQPLYPLLASRSLYEATISCLYRSVVFTIKRDKRDRWLSLLTSLRKHARLVRTLDLTEPAGPRDQTELGRKELLRTFLDRLAELSQLRELSIKCLGAKLPVEILVTASQLPRLRALKLNNLSLIGIDCDNVQFSKMEALREARLIDVREHDGSLKWPSFIPSTLNQSTQHFEYYQYQGSHNSTDGYSFLQILEEQPQLSFPEMRELCLPRPVTTVDVDRGLDLLRRCPSLQVLGFESVVFQRTWGTQTNELGARVPWDCLSHLRTIKGPPGLVSAVAPGRPVQKATILLDRQTEFPLLSTLEALRQSTVPLEGLSIFASNWRETSMRKVAELFPQLQGLAICVINVPAMKVADWELAPLFTLGRLQRLCLFGLDGNGKPPPQQLALQRKTATALFEALPSLQMSWLHVLSKKWQREDNNSPSSSKTIGKRIRGLLGVPARR